MSSLIDGTIQIVQKVSAELRPGMLDDLGLVPAIEWQAQEFQRRTAIACEMDLEGEPMDLDSERSTAVFRVFQEALTNVARHAQASKIVISLKKAAGKLELQVSDNGIGIPEEAVSASDSLGLMGMRERLLPFGGELRISPGMGMGTRLVVSVPLKEAGEK
jgi:two-component system sensor histidine kinase UhpB